MAKDKTKVKKKKWVQIIAPKSFREQLIGEVTLVDTKDAIGRTVKVNLMELTSDMKKQNTEIGFKIIKIQEGKALTEPINYSVSGSSIKRFVRRGKEKIDHSFDCETSDKRSVKVKPILITRFNVKKSVQTAIRKAAQEILTREIKKINKDTLFMYLVTNKLQKSLNDEISKIYPLKRAEIKQVIVKEIKKDSSEESPEEVAEETEEEKPKKDEKTSEEVEESEDTEEENESEDVEEESEEDVSEESDKDA